MNIAVITGTTRGLGAALAAEFTKLDWWVVSLNRPEFDLANLNVQTIEHAFAGIDSADRIVLINNAASHHIGSANELRSGTIQTEIQTNIIGPMTLICSFLRAFPNGEIANITSVAATTAYSQWSLYGSAKAAMNAFIEHLTVEGVKCFNLNPGAVDTDMQRAIAKSTSPLPADVKLKPALTIAKILAWRITRG